jgi:hypothetical protein
LARCGCFLYQNEASSSRDHVILIEAQLSWKLGWRISNARISASDIVFYIKIIFLKNLFLILAYKNNPKIPKK